MEERGSIPLGKLAAFRFMALMDKALSVFVGGYSFRDQSISICITLACVLLACESMAAPACTSML